MASSSVAAADPAPQGAEVLLLDQDLTAKAEIPSNMVIGNVHRSTTTATMTYSIAAKAVEYYSNDDESGSVFVGIEPFINGNLSFSIKVSSDSTFSSVNIIGSTFWLEARSLPDGGARVMSYYMSSASAYSYKSYDVPKSALPNGVNTINIMVSGTAKTLTVYHDEARKVSTPMFHWSVQNLPYAPMTSPIVCFDNYISSVATWTSTFIYGIRESVSGGIVSAVPGNDLVPFGIDYPRSEFNKLGTQYMAARGQKGVAWVDLQWLEYRPSDKAYIDSLLAAGWELGIHYNASLNNYAQASAQAFMKRQYDQVKAMFGQAPTSWCSYQNADSVTHATYAYQQLGMIWRNGHSGISYLANVGNLQETRWGQFWSRVSAAQMVYPSFTHKTDPASAEAYSISYSSFTKWVDNYEGKRMIGFYEYYGRVKNQVDTKITYLENVPGAKLRFSVDCNAFPSRLMIDLPLASGAAVKRNGAPLALGSDYTILDGRYIVLFANDNDVLEVSLGGSSTAPGAPTNLRAAPGNSQIALTWNAPSTDGGSPITGYKIYRGTAAGGEVFLKAVGNVLAYTDQGLTNGITYYYRVSAVNAVGEGAMSNEASATPSAPVTVPSAPTNLKAAPGIAQVTLTWSAPSSNGGSPITGYKVYRGTASGAEVPLATVGNVLTFTDNGASPGITYYYRVSAVNSAGEGALSNEVSATPSAPATAPAAPSGLTAAGGDGRVTLSWSAPSSNGGSPITGYKIYRGTAAGGETLLATVGNVLSYQDAAVNNGITYYYRVSAVNAIGEGAMSNEVSATPAAAATAPSAPRDLTAAAGAGQVVLSWSAPSSNGGSAITAYKVYRGTVPGAEVLLATVGNVLTYTDNGVSPGIRYYYTVSAVSSIGEGAMSNEASAVPSAPATVPAAPSGLKAVGGDGQVMLTWSAPGSDGGSPITGYRIYRGSTAGGETLIATVGNVLSYTDHGLVNGAKYYYRVSAVNSVGEGALSNEASATPAASPLPTDLRYELINGGTEVRITGYKGTGGAVLIPSLIEGRPVTAVANYAFYGVTTINSVTMSPGLKGIGNYAFYKCSGIISVVLPDGLVTIGDYAFGSCVSLTSVSIPGSVVSIGSTCFYNCASLATVTFSEGLQSIGDHAFYYCAALTSADIPGSVTAIANWAFAYSGVREASIPGSVTAIGSYAFYNCASLATLTIGPGVQSIGYQAFRGCVSLKAVDIPGSVEAIEGYAFFGCTALASLNLSPGLRTIGTYAFFNCGSITSVDIPGSVTAIGSYAFYYCSKMSSLTLGQGLKTIGDHAFYGCSALKTVTIPNTVASIEAYAFYGCTGMTSMYFDGNAPAVGTGWISNRNASLKIFYHRGAAGFTSPTWQGVPTSTY